MLIQSKINWFGLVGGAGTIALIMISLFIPWWIFKVGSGPEGGRGLVEASLSPVSTSLSGLGGDSFTVPLMWALNLTGFLTLAVGGVIMVIYSIRPLKPYSKRLLDFSFKKPLYSVAFFAVSLFALTLLINGFLGFNVPIEGSASVQIPRSFTTGASVSVLVSANLLWPFWFGVIVAGFCIAARFYHRRLTSNEASVSSQKDVVVG